MHVLLCKTIGRGRIPQHTCQMHYKWCGNIPQHTCQMHYIYILDNHSRGATMPQHTCCDLNSNNIRQIVRPQHACQMHYVYTWRGNTAAHLSAMSMHACRGSLNSNICMASCAMYNYIICCIVALARQCRSTGFMMWFLSIKQIAGPDACHPKQKKTL